MTPIEEKFNKEVGFVLHKIKEQALYTAKYSPIVYYINLLSMATNPLPEREGALLKKIEEWGGITLTGEDAVPDKIMIEGWYIYLNINQPKFDELYNKYYSSEPAKEIKPVRKPSAVKPTKTFPHKLPAGTRWEDFIIKFLDNNKVLVQVKGQSEELDYKAMGFDDKRSGKPDSQWAFLKILSAHGGEISWSDQNANDNFKKVKERLATKLKSYFVIDYDPFYPYSEGKSYKIKPTLLPSEDGEGLKRPKLGMSEEIQGMFEDFEIDDK
jgi:hypothetical protein